MAFAVLWPFSLSWRSIFVFPGAAIVPSGRVCGEFAWRMTSTYPPCLSALTNPLPERDCAQAPPDAAIAMAAAMAQPRKPRTRAGICMTRILRARLKRWPWPSSTPLFRPHGVGLMRLIAAAALAFAFAFPTLARSAEPYGIGLEGFPYPHPVAMLTLSEDDDALRMAYMDVKPSGAGNGRTVLLLHGRNFPSSYWEPTIPALTGAGYRVVIPDQIGFGKSSKPTFALSFDLLAAHTVKLLDHLQIPRTDIVAHSMGGMLAVRLARAYPSRVDRIVLEAPIGLEDYRNFAPPVETPRIMEQEDRLTAEGYRTQLVTNYSLTLPPEAITPFIEARMRIKESAEYPRWLRAFVNSYQMIYSQPVVYEIPLLQQPVLFVMGANDHNAPGRAYAPMEVRARMGDNARLAHELASRMPNGKVEVYEGIGHLVHLEAVSRFNASVLSFLNAQR